MGLAGEIPIGERLRFYRQGQGKKQAVVAALAGVTEDYISQIERGLKTPTITLLHRFAQILGVPVSALIGETRDRHRQGCPLRGHGCSACPDVVHLRLRGPDAGTA
ncbi:MAG: helix-turn-helix domain-containing protein [Streptomycetales bacterium]